MPFTQCETGVTGQQLVVQVKASGVTNAADYVVVRDEVTTLERLRQTLEVGILVKCIAPEREVYWLLL